MDGIRETVNLAPMSELEDYGAAIAAELAGAEAELSVPRARPFAGMSGEVMADVERLRSEQLDIFRQHVSIEQRYRVPRPGADTSDVRNISFSSIAGSMRDKEIATTQLLDRLDSFDRELRKVIGKFEGAGDLKDGLGETAIDAPLANDEVDNRDFRKDESPS